VRLGDDNDLTGAETGHLGREGRERVVLGEDPGGLGAGLGQHLEGQRERLVGIRGRLGPVDRTQRLQRLAHLEQAEMVQHRHEDVALGVGGDEDAVGQLLALVQAQDLRRVDRAERLLGEDDDGVGHAATLDE